MTYNEWRDELKSNLLCVSDGERRRVLDYYAEAYADRREAGFSEREIIDEFGAPYDAAQRILNENADDEPTKKAQNGQQQPSPAPAVREEKREEKKTEQKATAPQKNYGWVFVLLCIIFCVPLFGLIMGMVGITIGLCTAPFALVASGAATMGSSIGVMISGDISYGLYMLGAGFVALGLGIILFPLLFKIVKLMWKLFKTVFSAIKSVFTGKERAV